MTDDTGRRPSLGGAVEMDLAGHSDRAGAIEAARDAIRTELDELAILATSDGRAALAGRLARVAVDAVLRVREPRK